jgi:hypothetical protein
MTDTVFKIDDFIDILFKYLSIHNLSVSISAEDDKGYIKDYIVNRNKAIIKTDKSAEDLLKKDFSLLVNKIKQNNIVSLLNLSNKYDSSINVKLLSDSRLIAIQIPVVNIDDLNIILRQFGFKTPNCILFIEKSYIICYFINLPHKEESMESIGPTIDNNTNTSTENIELSESEYRKKLNDWLSSFKDIYPSLSTIPFPDTYTYIDMDTDTPVKCTLINCNDNFYKPYDVVLPSIDIYKIRYKSEMDYLKKNMFKHGFKSWQEKYKVLPTKLKEELDTYLHANGINVIDNYVSDTMEEIADHVSDIKLKTSHIMSFKVYNKQFIVEGGSVFSPAKFKVWYFYTFAKVINITSEEWNKFISYCSKAGKLNQASDVEDELQFLEHKILDFISSRTSTVYYVDKWTDANTTRDLVYLTDFELYKKKNKDGDKDNNMDDIDDDNDNDNTDVNELQSSTDNPKTEIVAIKYKHFKDIIKTNLSVEPKAKDITRIKTYLESKNYIFPKIVTRRTNNNNTADTFVVFIVNKLPQTYQDSIHKNLVNTKDEEEES